MTFCEHVCLTDFTCIHELGTVFKITLVDKEPDLP